MIYVIEQRVITSEETSIILGVLHIASSLELAHQWIKENAINIEKNDEYDFFFVVYNELIDDVIDTNDQEFYFFDSTGISFK